MSDQITITPAKGSWVVRAGGAVLGESSAALELKEGDRDPVIYFPKSDVAMEFLDVTETRTTCPLKGEAVHYSIVTKSKVLEDAGWSYDAPKAEVAALKDHIAFYGRDDVAVEQL
ncbi:MAG: DUF427 domain-containing protein [Silicimonas sp.]|nr:DUF427 domain-containing protein [Silicimonas sp.]